MSFQSMENSTFALEDTKTNSNSNRNANITYGIDDVPPWYLCLFMALQVLVHLDELKWSWMRNYYSRL